MYKHLFFDLDHTLWDFDRNSAESIAEIYDSFGLVKLGVSSAEEFSRHFIEINHKLWADYDKNIITHSYIRENRFPLVFQALGIADTTCCADLNDEYLRLLPRKPHLLDSAREVLDYLTGRYTLHIITNGFAEIQAVKLDSAEIAHYFTYVVTNQEANAKKPDPLIFQYALSVSGAALEESLMIGDNYEADILGAKAVGMDTVFYNTRGQIVPDPPTYTIQHWKELMAIL
ncbi:noncanonical pyrimidine nucleotidase, YjjG family [Fibrisoma montanum]|uniref:Noncanonical pyrimidine nucleotidase, YjjG family n=1 Tax=Fibrisoma montanum TaxID=2305895 RepID=A0A418MJ07_9BACT|nr:YjjG family noncanonical pyrimidine nucleotidase [Fibrisoma montanum]RIV27402.1 noncanonical pyrimidine nucleotidase, YjjG family [Fibrisoma montanum]